MEQNFQMQELLTEINIKIIKLKEHIKHLEDENNALKKENEELKSKVK